MPQRHPQSFLPIHGNSAHNKEWRDSACLLRFRSSAMNRIHNHSVKQLKLQYPENKMTQLDKEKTTETANSSKENDDKSHEVSNVSSRRFTYRDTLERRAMKQLLSNRRAEARYNESGIQQTDRRLANRLANTRKIKKFR